MEAIEYFNKDYFLLELQKAGAIKNDHGNTSQPLTLEEVPNITIGLVLAAKALKTIENQVILKWIRKSKNITALIDEHWSLYDESLIDEQFTLYDKLSIYLLYNVYKENDIHEWKKVLNGTKYISPVKGSRGWTQIFGNTPVFGNTRIVLKKVDPDKIADVCIDQKQKKESDNKDEKAKQENVVENENTNDQSCESNPSTSKEPEPNEKVEEVRNEALSDIKPEPHFEVNEERNEVLSEMKTEPNDKVEDRNEVSYKIKLEPKDMVDEDRSEVLAEKSTEPNDKVDQNRTVVLSEIISDLNETVEEDRNKVLSEIPEPNGKVGENNLVLSEIKPEPKNNVDEDTSQVLSEIRPEPNDKVDEDRNKVLSEREPEQNGKVDEERDVFISEIKLEPKDKIEPEPKGKVDEEKNVVLSEIKPEPMNKKDVERSEVLSERIPEPNKKVDDYRSEVLSEIKPEPNDKVDVDRNKVLSEIEPEPKGKVGERNVALTEIKLEPKDKVNEDRNEVLSERIHEPNEKLDEDRSEVLSGIKQEQNDKVGVDSNDVSCEIRPEPYDKVDEDRNKVLSEIEPEPKGKVDERNVVLTEIKLEPKDKVDKDRNELLSKIKNESQDKVEDRNKVLSEIKQKAKDKEDDERNEVLSEIKQEPRDKVEDDGIEVLLEIKQEPKEKVEDERNEVLSEIEPESKDKVEDDVIEVLVEIKQEPKDKVEKDRVKVVSGMKQEPKDKLEDDGIEVLSEIKQEPKDKEEEDDDIIEVLIEIKREPKDKVDKDRNKVPSEIKSEPKDKVEDDGIEVVSEIKQEPKDKEEEGDIIEVLTEIKREPTDKVDKARNVVLSEIKSEPKDKVEDDGIEVITEIKQEPKDKEKVVDGIEGLIKIKQESKNKVDKDTNEVLSEIKLEPKDKVDEDRIEVISKIKPTTLKGRGSDGTKPKSISDLSNLLRKGISLPGFSKDTRPKIEETDPSESDDGLEILSTSKKSKENIFQHSDIVEILSDEEFDECTTVGFNKDSNTKIPKVIEDGENDKYFCKIELELKVKGNDLAKVAAADIETPENSVEPKDEDVHRGFTVEYFYSILNEAGIISNIKSFGELTLYSHITVGLVCAIKALDIFTNEEIFSWIKQCRSISRSITQHDHMQLASYRELANYLMNEVDIKDEERWKIVLAYTSYSEVFQIIDQNCPNQDILQKNLQWEIIFGNVPEICRNIKIKFNYNFFLAQLLGYDSIRMEVEDGILTHHLVEPLFLSVGLVLAAIVIDLFTDKEIISWICNCNNINSIDNEKSHEQLAIYKEFGNYLEKNADERDFERVKLAFFITSYEEPRIGYKSGWRHTFNLYISLHKRFRDFVCHCDDLLSREDIASLEIVEAVDSVKHEPSEVCKLWNELFAKTSDQVLDKHSYGKPFRSNYFRRLLMCNKVTFNTNEKNNELLKLCKVEKLTVGLVMAAIHEKYKNEDIAAWLQKCKLSVSNGEDLSRQIFMYEILCDHFLSLECNIEAGFWKQLINSVEYQCPNGNCNIWSNIFGNQIQNLLGMTLLGNFEFERLYEGLIINHKERHKAQLLLRRCIQLKYDLQNFNIDSINEKQNLVFHKEYFASLLSSCGAVSGSSRIMKKVSDLTIGQVMAAIIDNTWNEQAIYEWIKQSDKNSSTVKGLKIQYFKFQIFIYKLLASHLMNYPCESQSDSYLNSWKKILGTQYDFSNIGDPCFEKSISPLIHSIYLSSKWNISMNHELKSIVHEIRKNFQAQSFENMDSIMLSNVKTLPKVHIDNKSKIFGFGFDFFQQKLLEDKVIKKDPFKKKTKYALNSVKDLTFGQVIGVIAVEEFKYIGINTFGIQNWITESLGFNCHVPLGFLMRISHYLLCEVPSELSVEWNHLLNEKFNSFIENKRFALSFKNLPFKEKKNGLLFKDINKKKHVQEYIPKECREFISGDCDQLRCKQNHICSKNKLCIFFLRSQDEKTKIEEAETMIDTNDEKNSLMLIKDGSEAIKASGEKEKYNNVVIFADKVYKPFIQQLELRSDSQKVWVAADDEFTPKNVNWYVQECSQQNRSGRLLCLLVTGLYDYAPLKNTKTFPLTELPSIGDLSTNNLPDQMIAELTLKGYRCKYFVETILSFSDKAVVVLVPPLPGFITQYGNDSLNHHSNLVQEYKKFCLQWSTMCCDMFSLQNLNYEIIMSYMIKCDKFISMMNPSTKPSTNIRDIKEKLNDWHKMIQQVLESDYKPQNVCLGYNTGICINKKETCQYVHKCQICGNEDHGKIQCNVLDKSFCLKYNTSVCDDIKCMLTHKCFACEQGKHAAINCKMNFIHHFHSTTRKKFVKAPKGKYKRVVLVGNQVALKPFVSLRIPELKVITNIKHLAIDVKLDSKESSMITLSILKNYMIKHSELSSETLWILISDVTNWLNSDSFCRKYFPDTILGCTKEIKMFKRDYEVLTQFYNAEEFVLNALPHLGEASDIILTPFIGQTVMCPPDIFPCDNPSVSSNGLLKMNHEEFHQVVHKTPGLQNFPTFLPGEGVNKKHLCSYLARFDQKWMDSVKCMYTKINHPNNYLKKSLQYCLQSYVDIKEETFKVLENIHLYPLSNTYHYWDAYMVLLIKYLCDPMCSPVELKSDFDKKVYYIKNKTGVSPDFNLHNLPGPVGYQNPFPSQYLQNSSGTRGHVGTGTTSSASTQIAHMHGPRLPPANFQNTKLIRVLAEIEARHNLRLSPSQGPSFPPGSRPGCPPGQGPAWIPIGQISETDPVALTSEEWFHEAPLFGNQDEEPHPSNNSSQFASDVANSISDTKYSESKSESQHKEASISKEPTKPKECIADAKRRIFVYNITQDLESEDLYDILQVCGDIEEFERDVLENTNSGGAAIAENTVTKSEMVAVVSAKCSNNAPLLEKWCDLCKIQLDCAKTLLIHKAGKWHRLQEIKQQKDCFIKDFGNGMLQCLICKKNMTIHHLINHLSGDMHKSMTTTGFCSVRFKNVHSVYRAYRMLNGRCLHNKILRVEVPLEDSFTKREKEGEEHEAALEKQIMTWFVSLINKIENKSGTTKTENNSLSKKDFDKCIDPKDFNINLTEGDDGHSNVVTKGAKNEVIDIILKKIELLNKKIEKKMSSIPSKDNKIRSRSKDKKYDSQLNYNQKNGKSSKNDCSKDNYVGSVKRKRSISKDRTGRSSSTVDTGKRKKTRIKDRTDGSSSTSNNKKNVNIRKNKRSRSIEGKGRSSSTNKKEKKAQVKNRNRSKSKDRKSRSSSTSKKEKNVDIRKNKRSRSMDKYDLERLTSSRIISNANSGTRSRSRSRRKSKDRSRSRSSSRSSSSSIICLSNSSGSRSMSCSRSSSGSRSMSCSRSRSRSLSKSRSGRVSRIHSRSNSSLSQRDESALLQQELPSPPPAPKISTSSLALYNQHGQSALPSTSRFNSPATSNVCSTQSNLIRSSHLSQTANQSKTLNTPSDSSSAFSVLGITSMLYNMCDQFDSIGQSLKGVLEAALEVKNNEKKMLEVFAVEDNIILLKEVLNIFANLLENVQDTQTKVSIENLINYTKQLIRMADNSSTYLAATSSSSTIPYSKMNKSQSLSSNKSRMSEFDVENAARHTLTKNTSEILAHIKRELVNLGITPTKDLIHKLAMEITVHHSKMNFSKSVSGDKSLMSEFQIENAARHTLKKDTSSSFSLAKSSSSTISYSKMNISPSLSSDQSQMHEFFEEKNARSTLNQGTLSPFPVVSSSSSSSSRVIPCYELRDSPPPTSYKSLLSEFDVEKAARNTIGKDMPYIVSHIKRELDNLGISPSKEIIRKYAMEITVHHFKMEAMEDVVSANSASSPMHEMPDGINYRPGSPNASRNAMYERPISIDYRPRSPNASRNAMYERPASIDYRPEGPDASRNAMYERPISIEYRSGSPNASRNAMYEWPVSIDHRPGSPDTSRDAMFERPVSIDYRPGSPNASRNTMNERPVRIDYGHGSSNASSNPMLERPFRIDYGHGSEMLSHQSERHLYQYSRSENQIAHSSVEANSNVMPAQQSVEYMFQRSGNMQLGNTWTLNHSLVSEMQRYSQGQDRNVEEHWTQGNSSVMPQDRHGNS